MVDLWASQGLIGRAKGLWAGAGKVLLVIPHASPVKPEKVNIPQKRGLPSDHKSMAPTCGMNFPAPWGAMEGFKQGSHASPEGWVSRPSPPAPALQVQSDHAQGSAFNFVPW